MKKEFELSSISLNCEVPAIQAVAEVESRGGGFIGGQPKILFEGHVFWRRLKAYGLDPNKLRTNESRDILYPKWTRRWYLGGVKEHYRLQEAVAIHREAALESASWGMFQIMGYHWRHLGYNSLQHFVNDMYESEAKHLEAFVRFIKADSVLLRAIREKDWARFARRYNGAGYLVNRYHIKMANAYKKYANI